MRQISINRPTAKVRGISRRLKALERWAHQFSDFIPYYETGQKFCNYKIPVLDRLVNPPTTTTHLQAQALKSLLTAAQHLANSPIKNTLPYYRVAVLLTLPNMFQSEVCVFYDQDYYQSFFYQENLLPETEKPSVIFSLDIPADFVEVGVEVSWQDEDCVGQIQNFCEKWWTIGQRVSS